ncbi:MAG TPA: response regulator [Polyangiaceae bacterium]|jgi:signal transduction histidine kinase|nr:response regulator [Polyangiaceae bacterium]
MDSTLFHHVLIADDSPAIREVLAKTLEREGNLRVSQVENGAEVLRFIEQTPPDLLICDQHMPVLNGLQALKMLRRRWSALELPVLVLTGNKSVSEKVEAFRFGANDYLTKPTHREELLARVKAQLALKTAVQQNLAARESLLQASKLQTVGRLAAGLAHELNTPAQIVSDNLHFLQRSLASLKTLLTPLAAWAAGEGALPEEAAAQLRAAWRKQRVDFVLSQAPEAAGQSLSSVERIASLIAELKAFTGDGGQEEISCNNVNDAIANAVAVSRGFWREVVQVELQLQPDLPSVPCYAAELNQVILQLLYNAVEAVRGDFRAPPAQQVRQDEARRGRVQIRSRPSGSGIEILISDDGPGVDPAIRDQIFDPFFTTKRVGAGTGQGLAVGYDVIVRRHQGRLSCEQSPLGGACFRIWLPGLAGARSGVPLHSLSRQATNAPEATPELPPAAPDACDAASASAICAPALRR